MADLRPAIESGGLSAATTRPYHRHATLMRRMEDSNFRQVSRLTTLLMRMKRHELQMEALENTGVLHDVPETKGVSGG
jgi:hypothetical protein